MCVRGSRNVPIDSSLPTDKLKLKGVLCEGIPQTTNKSKTWIRGFSVRVVVVGEVAKSNLLKGLTVDSRSACHLLEEFVV